MKLWYIAFSIYILTISSFSCTDIHDPVKSNPTASTNHAGNDEQEDETCSPFCICSCCGSMAVNLASSSTFSQQEFSHHLFVITKETIPAEISFSIWQPPKFA